MNIQAKQGNMASVRHLLAENMRKYRHALGLSQANLAERVDAATHYIGLIETENRFPSADMIDRLAIALGIDPAELFAREIDPMASVKTYQKAALTSAASMVNGFFAEKLKELENED
jgi:transcriptional regulator with XRE-family HTH domain